MHYRRLAFLWALGFCLCSYLCSAQSRRTEGQADLSVWISTNRRIQTELLLPSEPSNVPAILERWGQSLGSPLQNVQTEDVERGWVAFATVNVPLRPGLLQEGQIALSPLLEPLRAQRLDWLTVSVYLSPTPYVYSTPGRKTSLRTRGWQRYYHFVATDAKNAAPVRYAFGYHTEDALRLLAPLGLLLLLPVLFTLWMRRRAINARNADPRAVWFGYWRFQQRMATALWLVWIGAALSMHLDTFLSFVLGISNRTTAEIFSLSLYFVPPGLILILCAALSQPVHARIRGVQWTQSELARQTAWLLISRILPINFFLNGVVTLSSDPRQGVLWLIAAFLTLVIGLRRWARVADWRPFALTTGDLRDRIFALAEKAGTQVRQVYVIPTVRSQMANAFAAQGNNVLLTDYLLERLSRREIDAVVGHELTHLRHRHPRKLQQMLIFVIAVPVILWVLTVHSNPEMTKRWQFLAPALPLLGLPFFYLLSRRFEHVADAGAVALTGDPEATITGLTRLSELNLMPMQWSRLEESLLTHPSMLHRVQAIAKRNDISPEHLETLLRSPVADDYYPLPPAASNAERVFSTTYKADRLARMSWTLIATMILPSVVAGWLANTLPGDSPLRWLLYVVGLVASILAYLAVVEWGSLWGYEGLRRQLWDKLLPRDTPEAEFTFVSFVPEDRPRSYEGFSEWDLGFLRLTGDRLVYLGEQTRFVLRRDQITEIRYSAGLPSWKPLPRIAIAWRDVATGRIGVFTLRPMAVRSLTQMRREIERLSQRLQTWRNQPMSYEIPPADIAEPGSPDLGAVTGVSPALHGSFVALYRTLMTLGLLAAGAAILAGLSFSDLTDAGWYVLLVAGILTVFQWIPYRRYREPKSQQEIG